MWWEKHRITRHYNAELQTTTQTLRATKYSIESTYSHLPCDLKVNRGKLVLINRPWKCKKGKDRRSPLVHSRKLAEHDDFTRDFPAVTVTVIRDRKIWTTLRTSQIAGFVIVPSWKKLRILFDLIWVMNASNWDDFSDIKLLKSCVSTLAGLNKNMGKRKSRRQKKTVITVTNC